MKVIYQGHKKRVSKAYKQAEQWVKLNNKGITPAEIAAGTINPKTGKPYSRQHVYLQLRKFK